jgi:hypothetical protein
VSLYVDPDVPGKSLNPDIHDESTDQDVLGKSFEHKIINTNVAYFYVYVIRQCNTPCAFSVEMYPK